MKDELVLINQELKEMKEQIKEHVKIFGEQLKENEKQHEIISSLEKQLHGYMDCLENLNNLLRHDRKMIHHLMFPNIKFNIDGNIEDDLEVDKKDMFSEISKLEDVLKKLKNNITE